MNSKLRVTFVLPRTGEWPSGGFRTVYEHASHLARKGHAVSVVHPGRMALDPTPLDHLKNITRFALRKLDGRFTPESWCKVDPKVRLLCVPSLAERFIPDGDAVIATAWETAEWVSRYSQAKGAGFYFIQHLETWNGPQERVFATWQTSLRKIVPSKWLVAIAEGLGQSAAYIPYGLNVNAFSVLTLPEERQPTQLMMLYHDAAWKGCEDGLAALSLVKERAPSVQAILFGVPPRPQSLPRWIEYHQSPSPEQLRDLYNRAAIFVAPSRTEGWGLTGCEALLCGAALAATDIDGHREFAFHEQTALTSPVRSPAPLADNILRLAEDRALRLQLARSGFEFVRGLTWERASTSFEGVLYGAN